MGGGRRGTTSWRARTLYSPTSMLALLVISYPDPKYRGLISRLGIEWMLQLHPRDSLTVSEGFLEGIDQRGLSDVFLAEEPSVSECSLLADYDRIFAEHFVSEGMEHVGSVFLTQ
jgi:hypothetical protein